MKYVEKWGDSIEVAVNLALQDLKLTEDQVNVIVLEEPTRGFFGLGSKLAKVRVEEKAPEKKETKPNKPEKKEKFVPREVKVDAEKLEEFKKADEEARAQKASSGEKASKKKNKKKKVKEKDSQTSVSKEETKEIVVEGKHANISAKPEGLVHVDEHPAKEFLEKTFKEMNLDVTLDVSANDDNVYVDVEGKDTGTVIGKRGQTLDAIQYLTSLVVNKGEHEYIRVIVDAEGYRAKREATLEKLACRLAEKVLRTGKTCRLEPMNPYERKVIHTTLQGVDGLNTRSEGDEPFRRVVIELKKK